MWASKALEPDKTNIQEIPARVYQWQKMVKRCYFVDIDCVQSFCESLLNQLMTQVMFLFHRTALLPSVTTGCYSPWQFPDSPTSAPAKKASPLGSFPPLIDSRQLMLLEASPFGGCCWPESHLRVGSGPPLGGWTCSCRGHAACGAVGGLSQWQKTTERPGRQRSRPACGTCQGGRERE